MLALPHSVEAEREVLSAVFIDPACLGLIAEHLTAADFYVERHALVFEAMQAAHQRNGTVDLVTLRQELRDRGVWEHIGGDMALGALQESAGTTANLARYCEIVKKKAQLRALINAAGIIQASCHGKVESFEVLVGEAEQRIREVGRGCERGCIMTAKEVVHAALERAYKAKEGDLSATGLKTGWRDVDALIGAIPPGLTILGAATKHGKSSLALQLATRIAGRGLGVVEWHGEMRPFQVGGRRIGTTAQINTKNLMEERNTGREEWDRAHRAAEKLSGLPILQIFETRLTASQICARLDRCIREQEKAGVTTVLAVLDHWHKVRLGSDPRRQRLDYQEEACELFSSWAKERAISLVLLAQPNKSGRSSGANGVPASEQIKGTGAITEEAELVLWGRRPCKHNANIPEDEYELHVVEQRQGPLGVARLIFNPQQMRFYDR